MSNEAICGTCHTELSWRFWDGHNDAGEFVGGVQFFCPHCNDRPRNQTAWGASARLRRIAQRIQFREMSERTGIPVVRISDIEAGYGDPPTEDEMRRIDAELAGLPAREGE